MRLSRVKSWFATHGNSQMEDQTGPRLKYEWCVEWEMGKAKLQLRHGCGCGSAARLAVGNLKRTEIR